MKGQNQLTTRKRPMKTYKFNISIDVEDDANTSAHEIKELMNDLLSWKHPHDDRKFFNDLKIVAKRNKANDKPMSLTDEELNMLSQAVGSIVHKDIKSGQTQIRLERKLRAWQEHPHLEFV